MGLIFGLKIGFCKSRGFFGFLDFFGCMRVVEIWLESDATLVSLDFVLSYLGRGSQFRLLGSMDHNQSLVKKQKSYRNSSQFVTHGRSMISFIIPRFCPWADWL